MFSNFIYDSSFVEEGDDAIIKVLSFLSISLDLPQIRVNPFNETQEGFLCGK